eukprot:9119553-Alexandrium_andersonii.AAC.1
MCEDDADVDAAEGESERKPDFRGEAVGGLASACFRILAGGLLPLWHFRAAARGASFWPCGRASESA